MKTCTNLLSILVYFFVVPLKDLVQWHILQNILGKNQEFPLKEHEVLVPDD